VHDLLVRDVAVGEDDGVHVVLGDERLQLGLRANGDASRVSLARELGRVPPVGDPWDLRRGEGDHLD